MGLEFCCSGTHRTRAKAMRLLIAFAILSSTFISAYGEDKPADHLKQLQGKWVSVSQESGGKQEKESDWVQKAWEFKGNEVTVTIAGIGGRPDSTLTFELEIEPTKNPAQMDLKAKNPKFGFTAVYKIDGDNLVVCWNAGRENRPAKLETTKNDVYTLITFKRAK